MPSTKTRLKERFRRRSAKDAETGEPAPQIQLHRASEDSIFLQAPPSTASSLHLPSDGQQHLLRSSSGASSVGAFFPNSHRFVLNKPTFIGSSTTTSGPVPAASSSVAFDLYRRRIATRAMHDSSERFDPPKCDEDTRVGLLEEIMTWVNDPASSSPIACITGPAGSGKSAVQQTIAEACATQGILAGSFFFSSGDPTRDSERSLFTTLIYQIAQTNKNLRPFIEQAIKDDPAIHDRALETQVNVLLIDTLQAANSFYIQHSPKKWPFVIVIDGLDECRGEEKQGHVLQIISKCFIQRKLPFKFLISSRPEYAIRKALASNLRMAYHIKLHEYDATADIQLYLYRRLRALGEASSDPRASDPSWPTVPIVNKLTGNSSGQFVYAATAVKFASSRRSSPFVRIQLIVDWEPGIEQQKNPFAALDALYHKILITAEEAYQEDSEDDRSVIELLRELILYSQASALVNMSISSREFETFLQLRAGQIEDMLSDLHSLIKTTVDDSEGFPKLHIAFHHKSFSDYLQDPQRCSGEIRRPDYLMYSRLLRSSLTWLKLVNYEVLDIACRGVDPNVYCDITDDQIQIVRFSLCYWTVYLFKALIMDFDPSNEPNQLLLDSLAEFFASDGWSTLKAFVRTEGLFRCSEEPYFVFETEILEEIWFWYLSQSVDLGVLPQAQQQELLNMISCLTCNQEPNLASTAAKKVNQPIIPVPRPLSVEAGSINPRFLPLPPRSIILSFPPRLSSSPAPRQRHAFDPSEDNRWPGSTPFVSEVDVEGDPVKDAFRKSFVSISSANSSRRESVYYSCSSHFGSDGSTVV